MTGRRSRGERRDRSHQRHHDRSSSRSRSRLRKSPSMPKRRDRSISRSSVTPTRRDDSWHGSRGRTLNHILAKLTAIEGTLPVPSNSNTPSRSDTERHAQLSLPPASTTHHVTGSNTLETAGVASSKSVGQGSDAGQQEDVTDRIVGALQALSKVRSQNYYISPFNPSVHDFDVWSAEVDRAKEINAWADEECLGRVGGSLRGDARSWLNEWVTSDRSWSNFKSEFRSLCPRKIDLATILYDVMNTSSDKFVTYAEYASKSLLRLNVVTGLSEELKVAIIARGITDPLIKAATVNSKPSSKQLVEFLSAFVKPKTNANSNNAVRSVKNVGTCQPSNHGFNRNVNSHTNNRCRICRGTGHLTYQCSRRAFDRPAQQHRIKSNFASSKPVSSAASDNRPVRHCSFCKRLGHTVDNCFQKQRSDAFNGRSVTEVNFCSDSKPDVQT